MEQVGRTSKYGSVKVTGTSLVAVEGNTIEILEDAVFTTLTEAGITAPLTSHNISGVQPAGEYIFAHTKFTGVQLASGSIRVGGYQPRRRRGRGLAGAIKNAIVLWLYGSPFNDQYITDKIGYQDRELLNGEIFPGRGYDGDQTNYINLGSNITFADNLPWAISCFVEWDVVNQLDGICGNDYSVGKYTRFVKMNDVTGIYLMANDANDTVTWNLTMPTVRHHVLVQNDGTDAGNLELFVDGVSQGTKTMADTAITIVSSMSAGGSNFEMDGTMDDFRVYSRTLNSTEIAALQTKEALGGELLWYPCEDVDLFTAFDASGNENHGTKVSWLSGNHVEGAWQNLMNKYGYNKGVGSQVRNVSNCVNAVAGFDSFSGASPSGFTAGSTDALSSKYCGTADEISLVSGKTYKAEFTLVKNSGTITGLKCDIAQSLQGTRVSTEGLTLTVEGSNVLTFTANWTGTGVFEFNSYQEICDITVSNLTVKEYYATEVPADLSEATVEDNLNIMDAGKGVFTSTIESWTAYSGNTVSWESDGGNGAVKILQGTGSTGGGYVYLSNAKDLNRDLTIGKQYRIYVKAKRNALGPCGIRVYDGLYFNPVTEVTTSYAWYTQDFIAQSATVARLQCGNLQTGEEIWIDEWYLVEVLYDQATPSLDCLGNTLVYAGQAKYHGLSVDAGCFYGDGAANISTPSLNIAKTHTIVVDFYPTAVDFLIIGKADLASYIHITSANRIRYRAGGSAVAESAVATIALNQWHRLMITRSGTATITFTLDGVSLGTDDMDANNDYTFDELCHSSTFQLNGKMRDVRVYSTVKTLAQISANGITDLVAWYPLCEEKGITYYDVSGNGKHATGVGVDETNWGTQDSFHYLRDYGLTSMAEFDGVGLNNYVTIGNEVTALSTQKVKVQVDYDINTYQYLLGGGAYVNFTSSSALIWRLNSGLSAITFSETGIPLSGQLTLEHDGSGNYTATIVHSGGTWTKSEIDTAYEFNSLDLIGARLPGNASPCDGRIGLIKIWVDDVLMLNIPDAYTGDDLISGTSGTTTGLVTRALIPALADGSADTLGNTLEYPQNNANAIPETYFKLQENIAELIAADLEDRYMNIMDTGKGVFTPKQPIMDTGKGVFTPITTNNVTNSNFTAWTGDDPDNWTVQNEDANNYVTEHVDGARWIFTAASPTVLKMDQDSVQTIGQWYKATVIVTNYVSGAVGVYDGESIQDLGQVDDNGTFEFKYKAQSTSFFLYREPASDTDLVISSIIIVEQNVEGWVEYGNNILSNDNGALKVTYADHASGGYINLSGAGDLSENLVIGDSYRVRMKVKVSSGGSVGINTIGQDVTCTNTTYEWKEAVFIATSTTANTITFSGMGSGESIWVEQWELIPQNIESWGKYGANIIENDSGALKVTYVDNTNGWFQDIAAVGDVNKNLTVGKTYQAHCRVKTNGVGGTVTLTVYEGSTLDSVNFINTEYEWKTLEWTAVSVDSDRIFIASLTTGDEVWLDEIIIVEKQSQTGNNMITDGEGFRWDDDNSDGIGNGWALTTGAGTPSIVTGNGFVGNAQLLPHVTGTNTLFQYSTGVNAVNGQTYQITGKFRADAINWRLYLRGTSDIFTTDMGVNSGDAASFSYTVTSTGTTEIIISVYCASGTGNRWIEVDEIEVRPVIPSFFYEPLALGLAPVIIKTDDLPDYRYLVQYYNSTNRKDLILLEAGHNLDEDDHNKLLKFTKNN